MKISNQKLKLLYLMRILLEKTDERHAMTVTDMIHELELYGVAAERKSVYNDLECLRLYGMDICAEKTTNNHYYVASREFELPELKLLVDSVQASKFITKKKSLQLIKKIERLTSHNNAKLLQRQVYVTNRVKTPNERIYYNVDKIHDAIAQNRKIAFQYFDMNVNKKKIYRRNGAQYVESPIALTWDDENYYLITYKPSHGSYTHYRVDKMEDIEILEELRDRKDDDFDLSKYAKKLFQMFNGEEQLVAIKFENELVGVVYDRFGQDVSISKAGDDHFVVRVRVATSPQFYAWVFSFGEKAEILEPTQAKEELVNLATEVLNKYK